MWLSRCGSEVGPADIARSTQLATRVSLSFRGALLPYGACAIGPIVAGTDGLPLSLPPPNTPSGCLCVDLCESVLVYVHVCVYVWAWALVFATIPF
jgi:hypothetical protein